MLIGVLVGTISTLFVYPLNSSTLAFYGNIQFIINTAAILVPFANLGITTLTVRFFPEFSENRSDHRGYLGLLYLLLLGSLLAFGIGGMLFRSGALHVVELLDWNVDDLHSNTGEILALTIVSVYLTITQIYLTNFQRVVIPSVLNSLFQKITIPALILCGYYALASGETLKWLFVLSKLIVLIALIYYTYRLGALHLRVDWSFITKARLRSMGGYALFGVMGSLSSAIAFRIDTVMIAAMLNFEKTGIYSIALFIANIMIIPNKSVGPLIGAQIAAESHAENWPKIASLYRKSAQSLLLLGMGFFLLVWWNLEDIFSFTPSPEQLMEGKMVVLFLGIAKLYDMVTGLNGRVIAYSKYYRWNLLFILLMGVVTVLANMHFIPRYGIVGAAIATLIALSVFNTAKQIFLWIKFRIQPFSMDTLKICAFGALASAVVWLLPDTSYPLVNIVVRSLLISSLFGLPLYFLGISPDINAMVDKYIRIIRSKLGW